LGLRQTLFFGQPGLKGAQARSKRRLKAGRHVWSGRVAGAWAYDSQSEVKDSRNKKAASLPGRLWCEGQLACQQHEFIMHDTNDSDERFEYV
jgi:hypothetical protein